MLRLFHPSRGCASICTEETEKSEEYKLCKCYSLQNKQDPCIRIQVLCNKWQCHIDIYVYGWQRPRMKGSYSSVRSWEKPCILQTHLYLSLLTYIAVTILLAHKQMFIGAKSNEHPLQKREYFLEN